VAKLLNCTTDDIAILVSAGKLRALDKPKPNAVKYFSSIELITLLANRDWLDEATKTISQHWRRKNARRNGLVGTNRPDGESEKGPDDLTPKAGHFKSRVLPLV
jgi:hypothetical protein